MIISKKFATVHSFNGTVYFSAVKICSHPLSDQLLLEYKFISAQLLSCFGGATISNYSNKTCTFPKQAVLPYSYFFRRISFKGAGTSSPTGIDASRMHL